MITFNYTLKDPMGLHARPAGQLVKEAKQYRSKVVIRFEEKSADALRMMAVMRLSAKAGDTVSVCVEGEDEAAAAQALQCFFEQNV